MPDLGAQPLHIKLRKKRSRPDGPFVMLTREFLESDAWSTAPLYTRKFVERLMIEHMANGGAETGRLICTHDDFCSWGIHKDMVFKAQKDAIRRGFVTRTEKGRARAGAGRRPNRFGLTFLPGYDGSAPTHRWRVFTSPLMRAASPKIYKVLPESGGKLNGGKEPKTKTGPAIYSLNRGVEILPESGSGKKTYSNGKHYQRGYCTIPGHAQCKMPKPGKMPNGWHWCSDENCLVAPTIDAMGKLAGVTVPMVDHSFVGTPLQKAAFAAWKEWERIREKRSRLDSVWSRFEAARNRPAASGLFCCRHSCPTTTAQSGTKQSTMKELDYDST